MKRFFTFTVVALLGLHQVAYCQGPIHTASGDIIKKGTALHDAGKYEEAVSLYRTIPYTDSNYVLSLYEISLSLTADSNFTGAKAVCEKALSLTTSRDQEPLIYNQYASVIDYLGDEARSIAIFDSAILKYPAYTSLHLNKAITQLRHEKYAEAEQTLFQALLINPYEASLHFRLGQVSLLQGKIIPAMLCFTGYLSINPSGPFHGSAIQLLNRIAHAMDDVQKLVDERTVDQSAYKELEEIILSKIALDKQFKPTIDLDDPISRQLEVLLEKLKTTSPDSDFYSRFYTPVFRQLYADGELEPLVNYLFSAVDIKQITEYNRKNKKKREKLINELVKYFSLIRSTRELDPLKRDTVSLKYYYNDGKISSYGLLDANDESVGHWYYYFPAGNLKSEGNYTDKGKRKGLWTFYYDNGKIKSTENYVEGELDKETILYYDNGVVSDKMNFLKGKKEGVNKTFYYAGGIKTEEHYSQGKLQGEKRTWYSSGMPAAISHYLKDSLDGAYTSFYQNGLTEVEATYTNGSLNGPIKGYHENGNTDFEGTYNKGLPEGEWRRYHSNGKLKSIEPYSNGLLEGEYQEYYKNGQLYSKYSNKKGKTFGDASFYDEDGKLYSILTYDDDLIKRARYFNKEGKQISESVYTNDQLVMDVNRPDGTLLRKRTYTAKGQIQGTATEYFRNGKLSETMVYEDGVLQGLYKSFFLNGKLSYTYIYHDGQREGVYENYYINGKKESEGYYTGDDATGDWTYYNELGQITTKTHFEGDVENGIREEYWPNGKKQFETLIEFGWKQQLKEFDSSGKVIGNTALGTGTKKYLLHHFNGKIAAEATYVNGNFEGTYKTYYFDGSPDITMNYLHGMLDGEYKAYYYSGQLATEGKYSMGDQTGDWKYYSENGRPFMVEKYIDGKLAGKKYFNDNGSVEIDIEMVEGELHGITRRLDPEGNLLYQLRYEHDLPVAYSYLGKDGKLVPEIKLPGGSGEVSAFYQNGNQSASFTYEEGKLMGPHLIFYKNGSPWYESKEYYSNSEGPYKIYYPNGKLKSVYQYENNKVNGSFTVYDEKGSKLKEGTQYNNSEHGPVLYYNSNGKVKETRHYYYGTLLSVAK